MTTDQQVKHYQDMADEAAGPIRLPNGYNLSEFVETIDRWIAEAEASSERFDTTQWLHGFDRGHVAAFRTVATCLRSFGGVQ